jgi:hypothetical protein
MLSAAVADEHTPFAKKLLARFVDRYRTENSDT